MNAVNGAVAPIKEILYERHSLRRNKGYVVTKEVNAIVVWCIGQGLNSYGSETSEVVGVFRHGQINQAIDHARDLADAGGVK